MRGPLLSPVAPRIRLIACNYAQPFLIYSAVEFVGNLTISHDKSSGYGLIGATIAVYISIALLIPEGA
jgi:ATP-binding cassette subfamily C (CFTR/MRP) protein 1